MTRRFLLSLQLIRKLGKSQQSNKTRILHSFVEKNPHLAKTQLKNSDKVKKSMKNKFPCTNLDIQTNKHELQQSLDQGFVEPRLIRHVEYENIWKVYNYFST